MKINDTRLIIIFGLIAILNGLLLGYTGRDDSHITYFVSDAWAAGNNIINYNGESIEQSSTLLFTVLLGIVGYVLEFDAAFLGPLLSAFLYGLLVITVHSYLSLFKISKMSLYSLFSAPLFYWSLSGMENSLYALLNFILCYLLMLYFTFIKMEKSTMHINLLVSICSGLLTITRPEFIFVGLLAIILFNIFIFLKKIKSTHSGTPSLAILIGMSLAFLLRMQLGLEVFPNTVIAKQPDLNLFKNIYLGLVYYAKTFLLVPFSSSIALWGFLFVVTKIVKNAIDEWERPYFLFLLALIIALSLFALTTGGDWMEAGRFLTTPMFLGAFGGMCLLGIRYSKWLLLLLCAGFSYDAFKISQQPYGGFSLFIGHQVEITNFSPSVFENLNAIHSRDLSFVDKAIPVLLDTARESEDKITIASVQAGMVPYYLTKLIGNELLFIDLVGLTTNHVHGCFDYSDLPYSPYHDINALQECIGIDFDFVYDVEAGDGSWSKLDYLKASGCKEVFREHLEIGPYVPWSAAYISRQFLVDCR